MDTKPDEIASIRRQLRFLKGIITLLLVVVLIGTTFLMMGATTDSNNNIVKADEFHLVDDQGETRVLLSVEDNEALLTMKDQEGNQRMVIGEGENGTEQFFFDSEGTPRIGLGHIDGVASRVSLIDQDKSPRGAFVFEHGEKTASVQIFDTNRNLHWKAP